MSELQAPTIVRIGFGVYCRRVDNQTAGPRGILHLEEWMLALDRVFPLAYAFAMGLPLSRITRNRVQLRS
ncbi:MAG: hypothetical protein P1R74_04495 [Sedimenticola sp.]|nr:hypothetical protein [Sedimenticola sp.]